MPTFARPSTSAPARPVASSPAMLSPAMTFVTLAALSCAALFLFARPDSAQNLPIGKAGAVRHKPSAAAAKSILSDARASSGMEDRQNLGFYTNNVRGGMFSAPVPAPVKAPVVVVVKPAPSKPIPVPLPHIDPFARWSYTGTVHMGEMTMALLENSDTKEGQYVKMGDDFMGAKVKSVTDQMVTLTNAGQPAMLAKADTIVITPLSQDAVGKNQQTQQAQNGPPQNGQAQAPGAPADASQFTIMGPNGQMLTGGRALRYKQRLDSGFSGGGGGNPRGGGGGRRGGNNGGGNNNGGG